MRHGRRPRLPGKNPNGKMMHLRKLVSSLLHHEMIVTTLARARYTARQTEKMIAKGKRGTAGQVMKAESFFLKPHFHTFESRNHGPVPPPLRPIGYPEIPEDAEPGSYERPYSLMSKVFKTLAERYKDRTGGFTRIFKYGRRKSDKAKMAIVCLVDGPKDLKPEILARQIGKQAVTASEVEEGKLLEGGLEEWRKHLSRKQADSLERFLKFRTEEGKKQFEGKVREFADYIVAESETQHLQKTSSKMYGLPYDVGRRTKQPWTGYPVKAGQRLSGTTTKHSALRLSRGLLGGRSNVMGNFKREVPQPIDQKFFKRAGAVRMASAVGL